MTLEDELGYTKSYVPTILDESYLPKNLKPFIQNLECRSIHEGRPNGNGPVSVTTNTNGIIKVLPPKTAKEVVARERERKARTTLLMALPKDHLEKFHKMADEKEMWEAIKSRFSEGLHKGYDRFQTLLSQLEIHGAGVSHKVSNQKFVRSLPSSWSQVALIIRTKPGLDTLSFDDLYNNLRVFESDVKGTTASSSNIQNVAFVSVENTSSTNDFDTKDPVGFDKTKVKCFNCHKMRHFARDYIAKGNQDSRRSDAGYNGNKTRDNGRRPAYQDDSKALVTIDGEDIDWSGHVEEDAQNYAMMAYSSSNSGSDNEVVFAAKLPILNHNEFDLWKMWIELYLLMANYSLWEVILNGDSPIPTRVIDDQIHDRLQKLISQLEILGESLSQEDINMKFLRSLPTEWRTHTLIWRNKTDLEDQSLDDLFNSLEIYEDEVKSLSSTSPTTQNIAFVSSQNTDSTNESASAITSVFTASTKVLIFALPNVDTLSDAVIYSFFASQSISPQLDN
nr:xylulose kinase-1 [Tanacetum cinerariifolium]